MKYMIIEKTGWTDDYIMWGLTWLNLRLMLADAPSVKKIKKVKEIQGSELAKILGA